MYFKSKNESVKGNFRTVCPYNCPNFLCSYILTKKGVFIDLDITPQNPYIKHNQELQDGFWVNF